ncbi:MAG: hypothetical protein V3R25_09890 [Nitrosomonadaceae bacterium]
MTEEQAVELSSNEEETEQLPTTPEAEAELEGNSEESEQQEPEEFEIVLGSAEEPSAEEKAPKKPKGRVRKLLAERRENKDEIAVLRREVETLRSGALQANTPASATPSMPIMPTEESVNYDPEAFRQAQVKYSQDVSAFHGVNATAAAQAVYDQQQTSTQMAQESTRVEGVINAHYDRAEKLNIPDYEAAEDKVIEILDQNAVSQIAQIVPNSEQVVYYLGKNPDKAHEIREIWERNPGAAAFKLGELSKDLKVVPKQRKQRPAPESKVTAAAPASASSLEKAIVKERQAVFDGKTDLTELMKLKKQLASA